MKKIFIALAAVAAMVGCSKENAQMEAVSKDSFKMNASIVLDETRVTVDGDKFTEVKWEQGDKVTLSSAAGASATLTAESAGDTDVRFVGEGSAVADTDTYYAIYPATTITDGVANIELASQSGDDKDSAVLVAKAEGTKGVAIDMEFKPANALLHVAVSGVSSLSKAEFVAFDGAMLPQGYTYSFSDSENAVQTYGEVSAYTIENPSKDGFFFSLPAGLDMANGYVVRLTDANGNVCSKAYNGKTFAKATTSRVAIDFATPSVTLGAKTSYSYYAAGDSATANKCANTDIFFVTGKNDESCASSYAGVQDAMISDLGYEIDGTTYTYSAGQVSWDKAANTFCINEQPTYSAEWGEKTAIKAFVVVEGKKYYSTNNVWLTGMPYSFKFYQSNNDSIDAAGWKRNGDARMEQDLLDLKDGGMAGSGTGWVASPAYYAPQTIETALTLQAKYYVAALRPSGQKATLYVGTTTSNTSTSSTSKSVQLTGSNDTNSSSNWSTINMDLSFPNGKQYLSINHNSATYYLGSRIYVCNFELKYK